MITIEALNKKIWYRLLKVIYIGVFILLGLIIIFSAYEVQDDSNNYVITCNWNNESFKVGDDATIIYLSSNPSDWSPQDKESVASECFDLAYKKSTPRVLAQPNGFTETQLIEMGGVPTDPNNIYGDPDNYINYVTQNMDIDISSAKSFKVVTPMETSSGILHFIEFSLIGLIIEAIVFEFIKRVFYYVLLGKMFNLRGTGKT